MSQPQSIRSVRAAMVVAALLLTLGCWIQYRGGFYFWGRYGFAFGNDDAFISFRYAANLVDHGILSFNLTDKPYVEGFSNPLHVALAALVYSIVGRDGLYPAMALLGWLSALLACVLLVRYVGLKLSSAAGWTIALAFSLYPPLWIHATDGLETAQVILLQVVIWIAALSDAEAHTTRTRLALIVCTMLSVLLRTDGFVFPVIAAGWLVLRRRHSTALYMMLAGAGAFFALMAARYMYYGEIWPNTYYAKINGSLIQRLEVAGRLLGSTCYKNGFAIAVLGAGFAGVVWARSLFRGRSVRMTCPGFEVWTFAAMIAYYFLIGGDIYRERFLVLLVPLGLVAGIRALASVWSVRRALGLTVVAVAAQCMAFHFDPRLQFNFDKPKWDRWVFLGKYLGKEFPNALMATGAAGKLPYYSQLETIDMLGLNDRHIARTPAKSASPGHGRYDVDYVLSRRPDIITDHAYGDGHLVYGLDREVYTRHGYVLAFLVRSEGLSSPPLVATSGKSPEQIKALIDDGYIWGVLLRGDRVGQSEQRP